MRKFCTVPLSREVHHRSVHVRNQWPQALATRSQLKKLAPPAKVKAPRTVSHAPRRPLHDWMSLWMPVSSHFLLDPIVVARALIGPQDLYSMEHVHGSPIGAKDDENHQVSSTSGASCHAHDPCFCNRYHRLIIFLCPANPVSQLQSRSKACARRL